MTFKPLLASPADFDRMEFPLLASPKLDGIRCLIHPDLGPVTRTMKPIPNLHVRQMLSNPAFKYLDGEIVTYIDDGKEFKPADFNTVQSCIMRADGQPIFLFQAFDSFRHPMRAFEDRLKEVQDNGALASPHSPVQALHHESVFDMPQLMALVDEHVADGFEGTMTRSVDGVYKHGRSTAKEGILSKIKRFFDDEAVIVGVEEKMLNKNDPIINALGNTERSSAKGGKVPAGTLGALVVKWRRKTFNVGTGFDEATRADLWRRQEEIIGQTVTFKYQEVGSQGAPRFPVFLGLRYDLSV